jgi:hypothetical protein
MKNDNKYTSREAWLQAATNSLRPYFEKLSYRLPEKIRFAIAFTSGGKKGLAGECWRPESSADGHYEIIIKADRDDPVDILGILVHELVHALLPLSAKHGKKFKAIAGRVGLEGKMREAAPGPVLHERLSSIAENLGPLPHARLDFATRSDAPKKSGVRMLKAECSAACGYTIRLIPKWAKVGLPVCPVDPKHGRLRCILPDDSDDDGDEDTGHVRA